MPAVRRGPVTVDHLSALPLGIGKAYACQLVATDKLDVNTLGKKRIRVKSASLLRLPGEG